MPNDARAPCDRPAPQSLDTADPRPPPPTRPASAPAGAGPGHAGAPPPLLIRPLPIPSVPDSVTQASALADRPEGARLSKLCGFGPSGHQFRSSLRDRGPVVELPAAGGRVAPQLAGNRRRCSAEPAGDLSHRDVLGPKQDPNALWQVALLRKAAHTGGAVEMRCTPKAWTSRGTSSLRSCSRSSGFRGSVWSSWVSRAMRCGGTPAVLCYRSPIAVRTCRAALESHRVEQVMQSDLESLSDLYSVALPPRVRSGTTP